MFFILKFAKSIIKNPAKIYLHATHFFPKNKITYTEQADANILICFFIYFISMESALPLAN